MGRASEDVHQELDVKSPSSGKSVATLHAASNCTEHNPPEYNGRPARHDAAPLLSYRLHTPAYTFRLNLQTSSLSPPVAGYNSVNLYNSGRTPLGKLHVNGGKILK